MRWPKNEVLLALELVAVTSFAISRPILSSFGELPGLFVSRDAYQFDVVVFALAVTVLPLVVVVAIGASSRLAGERTRRATHVGLVALLAGLGVWRTVHDPTGGRTWSLPALAIAVAAGAIVALLRSLDRSHRMTASFLRFASIGAVVFVVQFLWLSPVGSQLVRPAEATDEQAIADAIADLGDDAPPVIVLVLDELPTMSLLDGTGAIDRELFPHLAALADDATWYRNHTTVSGSTFDAVPALATGRLPAGEATADRQANLISLLSSHYDVSVHEVVTRLCPDDLCPRPSDPAVSRLLGDAARWWRFGITVDAINALVPTLPGATGSDRYERARDLLDSIDVVGERPTFTFVHLVLPHGPWQFTNDGEPYAPSPTAKGVFGFSWTDSGLDVGRQRHLLQVQATDALVGRFVDRLRDEGVYDDALLVVTGDHGVSFAPHTPTREMVGGNEEHILWTPLFLKPPGQTSGAVDDSNVLTIDVAPTIADELGIDLPWSVDGLAVGTAAAERPQHRKPYASTYVPEGATEPADPVDGAPYVEIDTEEMFSHVLADDPVRATGPDAVWRLTDHGSIVGEQVDAYTAAAPVDGTVTVTWPTGFDGIDMAEPLPLQVVAGTDLPAGTVVAFALDGVIATVGEVQDHREGDGLLLQGMLVPWAFHDGDHELEAFVVTGDTGAPTLAAVDVAV